MRWVPSPDKGDIPLSGEGKDEVYSGLGKLDWLNRRAPAVSTEMNRKNRCGSGWNHSGFWYFSKPDCLRSPYRLPDTVQA